MGLVKTEEEIEEWYQDAGKALDDEFDKKTEGKRVIHKDEKALYKQKLMKLKDKYETYHKKLKTRDERTKRILRSKLLTLYFKLEWKLRLFKVRLSKEEESNPEKQIPENFVFYLNWRL